MIRRTACLTALIAALAVVCEAQQYRLSEETTLRYTLRFAGAGERTVTVRNLNGTIRVAGSTDPSVHVEVKRTVHADSDADLRRGERETVVATTDRQPEVSAIVTDPSEPICGESGRRGEREQPPYHVRLDFSVTVPANTRPVLCTINGEFIEVRGTAGDFDISNVNGRIDIDKVRGSGSATTVNGPITATLLEVPRSNGVFRTVNGAITVTCPAQLAAELRMKTFNGGVFTDFDVVPMPSPQPAGIRRNGRFVFRANEFALVRVGSGGLQLTFETLNGDVRVLRAAR